MLLWRFSCGGVLFGVWALFSEGLFRVWVLGVLGAFGGVLREGHLRFVTKVSSKVASGFGGLEGLVGLLGCSGLSLGLGFVGFEGKLGVAGVQVWEGWALGSWGFVGV